MSLAHPRRALGATALVVGVAALLRVVHDGWFLNYDARYALLWSRDAWHGFTPEYTADFAPTPHPLATALSSLALPFGDGGDALVVWAVLLCFGLVGYLTYRLGAELFSPWVGLVAAVAVLTRPALQRDAVLAYQDVPFAALILLAVLLEARRPRRGAAVLVLLALAGLLRPEAWVLSGLYLLYLWRMEPETRRRPLLVVLTALAPVVWALTDWLVTGDALHSLHGTAELAEAVDRRRSLDQVPRWGAEYLGFVLREPLLVGVPIGLAFAWVHRRRQAALPIAVAAAMLAVFAIGPLFGLPLIGRYVRTTSILLMLFYGVAVAGWMLLPDGRARKRWMVAGIVALAASVVYLPWHLDLLRGLDRRTEGAGEVYEDLRAIGRAPEVRAAFAACGGLTTADRRPIPYIRWWIGGDPGTVGTLEGGASELGDLLLSPRRVPTIRRFYREALPPEQVPAGWRTIYRNRSWRVDAAPGCAG